MTIFKINDNATKARYKKKIDQRKKCPFMNNFYQFIIWYIKNDHPFL